MRNRTYILLILPFILNACVEEVPVNLPPYRARVVVNGIISDKDLSEVQVSKSISSLDTNFIPYINNASVQLLDQNNVVYDILSYNSFEGRYIGSKIAQRGVDYTVKVLYDGKEVTSTTSIDQGTGVYNFNYVDSVGVDSSLFPIGEVAFTFNDIAGQENFYRLNLEYFDNIKKQFISLDLSDNIFLDAEAELTDKGRIFDDNTFSGQPKTIAIQVPFGFVDAVNGDYLFRVSLESLNQDYTRYEKSRKLYEESFGGLFTEPVELYSNIKSGLGIFGGVSVSRDTLK